MKHKTRSGVWLEAQRIFPSAPLFVGSDAFYLLRY